MHEIITPLLITYNEAPNLRRTLDKLLWAKKIVVIDSGSTDDTIDILRTYPQVETIHRAFDNFAEQWNFGLANTESSWVLSLDADYALSDDLVAELRSLAPQDDIAGYVASFLFRVHGRSLRGSLYPERVVLFRKSRAIYRMDGHTQRLSIDGTVLPLAGVIYHDDRKPLSRWIASQQRYASSEADHLLALPRSELNRADRLRLMAWSAPIAVLFYVLFVKGCVLDGWAGWLYALQRVVAEALLALELTDRRLRRASNPAEGS